MILQRAEALAVAQKRELIERLKVMVLGELRGPGADPGSCPRCHHAHVVRKGRDPDGAQRWLRGLLKWQVSLDRIIGIHRETI